MPTVPDTVFTQNMLRPLFHGEDAAPMPVGLKGASNMAYPEYAPGVLLGEITASLGVYAPYNPAATDGTQSPKVINRMPVSVDGSNNITWPGDFQTVGRPFVDVFRDGTFALDAIIGLDANALAIMQGSVKEGVIGANEVDTITLSAATNTFDIAITGPDGIVHNFLGFAGNATAASIQAALQAVLGIGSVIVALAGLVYTLTFGGAWGTQAVTVGATGHTITATPARTTAGAGATVPSGAHGVVTFGV